MKNGELQESAYVVAKETNQPTLFVDSGNIKLFTKVSWTIDHATKQVRHFQGIGDTLEDDDEHIHVHQISAQIETHISIINSWKRKGVH